MWLGGGVNVCICVYIRVCMYQRMRELVNEEVCVYVECVCVCAYIQPYEVITVCLFDS